MALKNIETCTADRRRFVLVVDSNDRNQQFLSTLLKQFEYDVYAVRTAAEALDLAAVVSPVLIITARQIGDRHDAIAFIGSFKKANPHCRAPFIVIVGKADPPFERACLAAGALTCLRAPVTIENFYRVIQVAIEPVPRMTIRISANLPARIQGTRTDECVRAISENGAYIMTRSPYPLKSRLPVQIMLAGCVISADAEVIYRCGCGDDGKSEPGMGLQFVSISDQDRDRIRLFIRKEMTKGIRPLPPVR